MSENYFVSSLMVFSKTCNHLILISLVLFNYFEYSSNLLNQSLRHKWPLNGLNGSQSQQLTNQNNHNVPGVYFKEFIASQSSSALLSSKVKSSDPFGPTNINFSPNVSFVAYPLASDRSSESRTDGKHKSKAIRSVANSGKSC